MYHHPRTRPTAALLLVAAAPFVLALPAHGVEPGPLPEPATYPADRALSTRGSAPGPDCAPELLEAEKFLPLPADPKRLWEGVEVARVRAFLPGLAEPEQVLHAQRKGTRILATLIDARGRETSLDAESFFATAPDGCGSDSGCTEGPDGGGACCVWACSPGDDELGFDPWIVWFCVEV